MPKLLVAVNGRKLELTNLEKLYWSQEGITKGEMIDYYRWVAPMLLPHLRERPLVLVRYPDGIAGDYFYQKECPDYAPDWVQRTRVEHEGGKVVNYILCHDRETLLWVANQGAIELHPWLSRVGSLSSPDLAVFDLDPNPPASFEDALSVALLLKQACERLGLRIYPKTSGASGLHLCLPLLPRYSYHEVSQGLGNLCRLLARLYPEKVTVERTVAKRGGRVYLDYPQNARGKTIAAVYSLRPQPGAPVSTPVTWQELGNGIEPQSFNCRTIRQRLERVGDLFAPVLTDRQRLEPLLALK